MKDKFSQEVDCIGCHKKFDTSILQDRCRVTIKGSMHTYTPETWDICPECRERKERSVYSKFKSKQYLHDWAREIMTTFPEINEIMTESRLRELGVELILKYKESKNEG